MNFVNMLGSDFLKNAVPDLANYLSENLSNEVIVTSRHCQKSDEL
jgi:hypothetical protein